jgi:hypothetical protein
MPYEVRGNLEGFEETIFGRAREALRQAEEINNRGGSVTWIKKDGKPIHAGRLRDLAALEHDPENNDEL